MSEQMRASEYKCPTCGRLDPFNQTIEDALRAEVAALKKQLDTAHKTTVKYIEEDNAGYLAAVDDVARLQAELARPEPMVPLRLVEGIRDAFVRRSVVGEAAVAVAIDAAIREGER